MATEEYTVVWNGSRTGPGRGTLLDYTLPHERAAREPPGKRPTLDVSRPPWERAGLSRSTYYRRRAAAKATRPASAGDVLELLSLLVLGR